MASLMPHYHSPTALNVHQQFRVLEVAFDDGACFRIPFELMRIHLPSAEVQGHGPGQEKLQTGKRDVLITDIAAVGHCAGQPRFSDRHDTGFFSWDRLDRLGAEQAELCRHCEARLNAAGVDRDAPMAKAHGSACACH